MRSPATAMPWRVPAWAVTIRKYQWEGCLMRKAVAALLLIGACCGPTIANGDGAMPIRHERGCGFEGRWYAEGQFCSLECRGFRCDMQVCHGGHWVLERAACRRGFWCPHYC